MRLGVDFGTTRTVVAYVDRDNYPVVTFTDADGESWDHFPAVVALDDDRLWFGYDALQAAGRGAPVTRSFKRLLAGSGVNDEALLTVGGRSFPLMIVLTGYLSGLLQALRTSSSISEDLNASEAPSVVVAVPAHAHTAQRLLTLDAFRRAGFDVTGVINEPSAAGFEYTHRQARTVSSRRSKIVVFDLGGGTFDASLVSVDDKQHEVIDSIGVNDLGGDDFDRLLADCAARVAGVDLASLQPAERAWLLDEAREAKERLSAQTRRVVLDVAHETVIVPVDDFYAAAAPLVRRAITAMMPLIDRPESALAELAGVYLVGGSSSLPLIPRLLREQFGRRVHRSPYPTASTAIGLAIGADSGSGFALQDRLSHGFGVFRETGDGQYVSFDSIFDRSTLVGTESVVEREYRAAHNIGWFRFVEYSHLDDDAQPRGDLTPYGDVVFAFDAGLRDRDDLREIPVQRGSHGPLIRERYVLDRHGIVTVSISDLHSGYRIDVVLDDDTRAARQIFGGTG